MDRAEDDQRLTPVLTLRAFEVLHIKPGRGRGPATDAPQAAPAKPTKAKASRGKKACVARRKPNATKTRVGTKQASLIEMLRAPSSYRAVYRQLSRKQRRTARRP
ncbi:hypothetical protein MesoLjLb_33260 [Mesorhizobium sp. L-8-3]|nr:hypothetical protein MesoLjLb_33260 [Mesorhizobium sp. L-8-3]